MTAVNYDDINPFHDTETTLEQLRGSLHSLDESVNDLNGPSLLRNFPPTR